MAKLTNLSNALQELHDYAGELRLFLETNLPEAVSDEDSNPELEYYVEEVADFFNRVKAFVDDILSATR